MQRKRLSGVARSSTPYHDCIRVLLDARRAAGRPTILVAQHSMTDCYKSVSRPMHAAVLYNRDRRFAGRMLEMLRREEGLIVGDNEPYFVSDETDYAIPRYGRHAGCPMWRSRSARISSAMNPGRPNGRGGSRGLSRTQSRGLRPLRKGLYVQCASAAALTESGTCNFSRLGSVQAPQKGTIALLVTTPDAMQEQLA